MSCRRDGLPIVVGHDGVAISLPRLPLAANNLNEGLHLRDFVFHHPACLPIYQIAPMHAPLVPIGIEITTAAGPLDCLFISPTGLLTLVETKLWRNPEARREVVGQIIDYAKEVATWSYDDLDGLCRKANGVGLWQLVSDSRSGVGPANESEFIDLTASALHEGRFLLLVIGDGIREDVERMTAYLQAAPQLLFALHLIELQFYELPDGSRLVIPQHIARTVELTRAVVRIVNDNPSVHIDVSLPSPTSLAVASKSRLSQAEFLDTLEQSAPGEVENARVLIDAIESRSPCNVSWHTASFVATLPHPSKSGTSYSLLNVTKQGKAQVWAVRDQLQRSGLEALADTYLKETAALVGAKVVNGAWDRGVPLQQLSPHLDQLVGLMQDLARSVRQASS